MQQTDKYKLNLIETSDPFSPAPLNENAEKTEAALDAQDARIIRLENCRIALGTYTGDGASEGQIIDLGERPLGILVSNNTFYSARIAFISGDIIAHCDYAKGMYITDNGFWVNDKVNISGRQFSYIAFLGGWDETHFPTPEG